MRVTSPILPVYPADPGSSRVAGSGSRAGFESSDLGVSRVQELAICPLHPLVICGCRKSKSASARRNKGRCPAHLGQIDRCTYRLARPGRQQRRHVRRRQSARSRCLDEDGDVDVLSRRRNDLGLLFPGRPQPPGAAGQASTSIRPGSWRRRERGPLADTRQPCQPGQFDRPVSDGLEKSTFLSTAFPPDSSRSRRLHAEADPQPTAACGRVATVCRRSCLSRLPPRSRIKNEAANELGMACTDLTGYSDAISREKRSGPEPMWCWSGPQMVGGACPGRLARHTECTS